MLRVEARTRLGALELDVALEVAAGECLALAGPSGAGKTSVLRVAAGLLRPEHGLVEADGKTWLDTARGIDLPPERRSCGYVFQEYALFPHMRAWQNVAYSLRGPGSGASGRWRCSSGSGCASWPTPGRARCRAGSGSASRWPGRSRASPRCCCSTSRCRRSTPARAPERRASSGAVLRVAGVPAVLVTHDFSEAALLGDRVGVIDAGHVLQEGTPSELAATPRSAFVADFTGAVVLTGTASAGPDGLTRVDLDGGGAVTSTDRAGGEVAVSVYPWEIAIEPAGEAAHGSTQNRLAAEVVSVTVVGNRVRLGLAGPQPLAAEITGASAESLGVRAGDARDGGLEGVRHAAGAALEAEPAQRAVRARRRAPTAGSARRPGTTNGPARFGKAASIRSREVGRDHVVLGAVEDQRGRGVSLEQPRRLGRLARPARVLVVGDRGAEVVGVGERLGHAVDVLARESDPGAAQKREP